MNYGNSGYPGSANYGQPGMGGGYPQQQYGYPTPNQVAYQLPPGQMMPMPPNGDAQLWGWFAALDMDRSGRLDVREIQMALLNGEWPQLQVDTARMMINMFDTQHFGTLDFQGFMNMVKYIRQWLVTFQRFDLDRSGMINKNELHNCLSSFGYNIPERCIWLMVRKYDRLLNGQISFDDFVKCCVTLKSLTDTFHANDAQKNGWATMKYDQYLEAAFSAY